MITRFKLTLLPACLLTLTPALAFAGGLAERIQDGQTTQKMDPISSINQEMGPTAAGPGQESATMVTEQPQTTTQSRYPADVETAYQKKRYIFDSNEF